MLRKIEDLKKDLEILEKEKIKAQGAYDQAMEGLKDLGYLSLEEAAIAVETMREDLVKSREEAAELIKTIRKKYADYITE